eukprot:1115711-Rhodomonas_salina.5
MSGTALCFATRCPVLTYALLCDVWYWPMLSFAISGTDLCVATRCPVLSKRIRLWTSQANATRELVCCSIMLRACYAMSGTDTAYQSAIYLRTCYAMSGTDRAEDDICLRVWYAMSGTDRAYAAW